MVTVLAGCGSACARLHIGPSGREAVRSGCPLLVRDDPCCIHYRGQAAILCSGSSGSFFAVESLWGCMCGNPGCVES